MQCSVCGSEKDHDILFNCNQCGKGFCQQHYEVHNHNVQANQGQNNQQTTIPMGGFKIDLSEFARRAGYQPHQPTEEDYENFLRQNPQVLTTGKESFDLFLGIVLIAFVFGFRPLLEGYRAWEFVLLLTIIISPAFILHELAHKYLAIYYGKYARFTLLRQMTFFTLLAGFIGLPIAGPGATMILGQSTEEESGIFSAGGPALNFVLSAISVLVALIIPSFTLPGINETITWALYLSAYINAILGLFNLIPLGSLDGKKILRWSPVVWVTLILLNLPLAIYSSTIALEEIF